MTNPIPDDWADLYSDGELPPELLAKVEQLLASDAGARERLAEAREFDRKLCHLLPPPQWSESEFLARLDLPDGPPSSTNSKLPGRSGRGLLGLLAVMLALVLAVVTVSTHVPVLAGVATLVRATGPIEVLPPEESAWKTLAEPRNVELVAGTRVRTGEMCLCEVNTASQGVVRVGEHTEIALKHPDEVELVAGQFWCRASTEASIRVIVPTIDSPQSPPEESFASLSLFTCPAHSETVWKVNDQTAQCISVAEQPTQLMNAENQSWTIDPGLSIACSPGQEPKISTRYDRLQETSWQLPLLNLRQPLDPELQSMLQNLLLTIGRSKMGGMYDDQIRRLGPAGTIPLIAFVRAPDSLGNPEMRRRAMGIIADLAPESTRGSLELLKQDRDQFVAQLAESALDRLKRH